MDPLRKIIEEELARDANLSPMAIHFITNSIVRRANKEGIQVEFKSKSEVDDPGSGEDGSVPRSRLESRGYRAGPL